MKARRVDGSGLLTPRLTQAAACRRQHITLHASRMATRPSLFHTTPTALARFFWRNIPDGHYVSILLRSRVLKRGCRQAADMSYSSSEYSLRLEKMPAFRLTKISRRMADTY